MALPEITGRVFDRELLTENLQIVRHVSGFFPLTERELFEAAAISVADRPDHGAAEHVQEVMRHLETRGYAKRRHNNAGAALTHEYARYYRSSGVLLGQVELLLSDGAEVLREKGKPMHRGAQAVVQFADIAAYQRGEETGYNPLRLKYRSKDTEMQTYIAKRVGAMPKSGLGAVVEETHAHLTARQAFWAGSLQDIGDRVPELRPNVDYVFRLTPLVSARRKMVR